MIGKVDELFSFIVVFDMFNLHAIPQGQVVELLSHIFEVEGSSDFGLGIGIRDWETGHSGTLLRGRSAHDSINCCEASWSMIPIIR
jgi:hypothetical protein